DRDGARAVVEDDALAGRSVGDEGDRVVAGGDVDDRGDRARGRQADDHELAKGGARARQSEGDRRRADRDPSPHPPLIVGRGRAVRYGRRSYAGSVRNSTNSSASATCSKTSAASS